MEEIANGYNCIDECWFNKSEITLDTIDSWPTTCNEVCGIITFNENSNVPVAKLVSTFANLTTIKGAIRVENTNLKSLSFLRNLTVIGCDPLLMSIKDNKKLEDASFLSGIYFFTPECPFQIVNNPKLNVSVLCELPNYENFVKMYVTDNLADCGCRGENFGTSKFNSCTSVFGTLTITNQTENAVSSLVNVKNITGNITVAYTSLQNLSFLGNLERWRYRSNENIVLNLHDNPNLKSIGWDNWEYLIGVDGFFTMNAENLHPDFCLTTVELKTLTSRNTQYTNISAVFCPTQPIKDGTKLCNFNGMAALENDCDQVLGNVLITNGDEEFAEKLSNVTHIFGALRIENTTLINGSIFDNLQQIAFLDKTLSALHVMSNPFLRNLTFPNLHKPTSLGNKTIIFENSPMVFLDVDPCVDFVFRMYMPVSFDGNDCFGEALPTLQPAVWFSGNGNDTMLESSTMAENITITTPGENGSPKPSNVFSVSIVLVIVLFK